MPSTPLGPGTLKIGKTGGTPATEIDFSCQINNARISMSKDQDDPVTKLCGTQTPGKITYTYSLSGNMDTDPGTADGIFQFSWDHAGEQVDFEFVPNTANGTAASGTLIIDPLDFGADDYGAPLDSDFEWAITGKPAFSTPAAS